MSRQSRIGLAAAALIVAALGLWWWRGASPSEVPSYAGAAAVLEGASESLEPAPTAEDEIPSERATAAGDEVEPVAIAAAAPTHVVRGRVVDERRYPVAGAHVDLCAPGVASHAAISGEDGRFELEAVVSGRPGAASSVRARDDAGLAGFKSLWIGPAKTGERAEVDAGTIPLVEAHSLRVRVLDGSSPSPAARVRVALGHARVFAGEVIADAKGETVLEGLPAGVVHVEASSADEVGHARAFVPEEAEVVVELAPFRSVDVLVVDAKNGAPIGGAELEVMLLFAVPMALPEEIAELGGQEYFSMQSLLGAPLTTDAEGRARIVGLAPDGRYELHVRAPGYESIPKRPASGPALDGEVQPLRVELERAPARTVRWPVIAGEAAVPPDGSTIDLRFAPGSFARGEEPLPPPPGHMEGTTLVVEAVAGRSFLARAPDGALAALWVDDGSELGHEASFRRPRQIEVLVRDGAGQPVTGALAIARNQGNNDLCEAVATSADGRAVLEGLHGRLADVYVGSGGGRPSHPAGTVDLEQGDGRVEVTLAAPPSGRLRVLIDGRPELPARFQVQGASVIEELPERGELVLSLRAAGPGETVGFVLTAPGFLREIVKLVLPADGSEAVAEIELARGAVLVADVLLPERERASISVERFDESARIFQRDSSSPFDGLNYPNGPNGSFVFAGLTTGRWRVVDEESGLASSEVELFPGEREARVELDLRSVTWVSGRVEVPDPADLARVVVLVEGVPFSPASRRWMPGQQPPEGAYVREGTFRVRVPGDRTVKLVPWHPWLVPAADGGTTEVRTARENVVLRLVEGGEVRLPVPQFGPSKYERSLRVGRYVEGAEGEPIEWRNAPIVEGIARFAVPRGSWTLWIDPGDGFAPLELQSIAVEGVTTLAPATFESGSSVRVRLIVPEGQSAPRIYVSALGLGEPAYHRGLNSNGESEVVLAGLGPGRFRVSASATMVKHSLPEREFEMDGRSEITIDFDLR